MPDRTAHPAVALCALALCAAAIAPAAMARDLSGEVAYRERVALSPGAVLVVEARGRDGIVAEARIPAEGRQVPLPWRLEGLPDGPLMLRAAIEEGGAVRWLGQPQMVAAGIGDLALPPMVLAAHEPAGFESVLFCGPEVLRLGFAGNDAVLRFGGEARRLSPVATASGAKHADGRSEADETSVWSKGTAATVRWSGGQMPPCRFVALPGEGAFTARGNEPFWRLDMSADGLVLTSPEGEQARTRALPPPEFGSQAVIYRVPGGPEVQILPGLCSDTMTGMPHPVMVVLDGETAAERRMGCGGEPGDLLQGAWTAVEMEGAALAPDAGITLEFDGDRVAGRSACNRYSGGFALSGEGLSFGPAAATRMACAPDLMEMERAFFAALRGVDRFEIDGAGDLLLIGADRTLLRARR